MASTLLDMAIILLLIASLGYGFIVNRRVNRLMEALTEIDPLVREFSRAVDKTEFSVSRLRSNLEEMIGETQPRSRDDRDVDSSSNRPNNRVPTPSTEELIKNFFRGTYERQGS